MPRTRKKIRRSRTKGCSVDEALRMVDALQFFEENGEVCPANWHKGDEGMKENAESVADYLSRH
jgi:peroxiredoxin (alkyl hydroperoxide reductase subunit C)